jgi:lysozyme family protein
LLARETTLRLKRRPLRSQFRCRAQRKGPASNTESFKHTAAITDAVVATAYAADAEHLIKSICDERLRFLQSLKTWPVFEVGWGRRVANVRSAALKGQRTGGRRHQTHALMEIQGSKNEV